MRSVIVVLFAALALARAASAPAAEAVAAPPAGKLAVVILPAQAFVWKIKWKAELSEDWTAAARASLDAAMPAIAGQSDHFSVTQLPSLSTEERAAIDEVLGVAVRIQQHLEDQTEAKALRAQIDRTLGPTLAFLHDRTGADYALGVVGFQAEQSAGVAAFSAAGVAASFLVPGLLIIPTVSGGFSALFLIDLRTGELRWMNRQSGFEVGGLNFTDLRDPRSAEKVLAALLEPYPTARPMRGEKTQPNETTGPIAPLLGGFELQAPSSWRLKNYDTRDNALTLTRDGQLLNEIEVELRPHRIAFPESGQPSRKDSTPDQLAQWYAAELQREALEDLQVTELTIDAELAGTPAFRIRYNYRSPPALGAARTEAVAIGAVVPRGLLLARLSAPQLNFFAKALPAFEATTPTVKLIPRQFQHRNNGR